MVPCKLLTFLFIFNSCKENKIFYRFISMYVIGLHAHAVQFGNNWMKKIQRATKICLSEDVCSPLTY